MSRFMNVIDAPKALQALALLRILDPLSAATIDPHDLDRVHVVPDAGVWDTPARHVRDALSAAKGPEIQIETRDSAKTPGIQIADPMAYSRRNYLLDGSCNDAVGFLRQLGP